MNGEEQLFSNGPTSLGDRDVAFSAMRSKMSMLEAIVEDLGQFIYDNQLQDHFIPHIMSLAHTSKQLNKEISVVENYLDFMVLPPPPRSAIKSVKVSVLLLFPFVVPKIVGCIFLTFSVTEKAFRGRLAHNGLFFCASTRSTTFHSIHMIFTFWVCSVKLP